MTPPVDPEPAYVLRCMDIWSGNRSVENEVSTPGMDLYVLSQPYRGASRGGDVHYVSLCAGGDVTRLILADVAGHGNDVAETSQSLRALMRRYMNTRSQTNLVRQLNQQFARLAPSDRFATAVVATYLAYRGRFMICNAGHPRPLWFQRATGTWSFVSDELVDEGRAVNLPLGLDDDTEYEQFQLPVAAGDLFVLYTDGITEARGAANDELLGEERLLAMASTLPTERVGEFGRQLLQQVCDYSGSRAADDDLTLLVFRFTEGRPRFPGLRERFRGYAKLFGLKPT